jgi:hypothetical protein
MTLREEEEMREKQSPHTLRWYFSLNTFWICVKEEYPAIHKKSNNILLRTPWKSDQPAIRPLPTKKKHRQTSVPRMWFKPMIPVFQQAKNFCTLDYAAIMYSFISIFSKMNMLNFILCQVAIVVIHPTILIRFHSAH